MVDLELSALTDQKSNAQQYFNNSGFALQLGQLYVRWLRSNGYPIFVQSVSQNLPQVVVVGIEVKHIPDHMGETLRGIFLYGKKNSFLKYVIKLRFYRDLQNW